MGGVRNGQSDAEPGATGSGQETPAVNASPGAGGDAPGDLRDKVEAHLQVAARLLRERQAPKAFGELVRASRSLAMTRRLAAALVTVSLKAGTEAAAITLLSGALEKLVGTARRDVQRQLARVLRRVDQLPRALEALESLLSAFPDDYGSRRVYQELLRRMGKWEALVNSLERESQEAFKRGEYGRAARATRWRARVQAEQQRNLARAAESYGKAATYLEQMQDADGAFAMRLDGLRVLHSSGASEAVLTAAASVLMSAAARLGRDEHAREVMEELGLIPARPQLPPEPPPPEPKAAPADPRANTPWSRPTREIPVVASGPRGISEGKRITKPEVPAAAPPAPAGDAPPPRVQSPEVVPEAPAPRTPAGDGHPTSLEVPAVVLQAEAPTAPASAEPAARLETPAVTPQAEAPTASASAEHPVTPRPEAPKAPASDTHPTNVELPAVELLPEQLPTGTLKFAAPRWLAGDARPTSPEMPAVVPQAEAPKAPASDSHPTSLELPAVVLPAEAPKAQASDSHPTSLELPAVTFSAPASQPPPPPPADEDDAERSAAEDFASPEDVEDVEEADDFAASEDEEQAASASAEGAPLTELFDIPDEAVARTAPPVAPDEDGAKGPESPSAPVMPEASPEREDPAALQRLESQLIARKAWRELAQFYLASAERAKDPALRAQALTRLAEVMETELNDPAGAARMYREIVALTGDRTALKEQVRLLSQRGDTSLVRRAVDEAVQGARSAKARADAYLTRAEFALSQGQSAQAKADFETAEALTPGLLLVRAGLVRCVSDEERPAAAQRMRGVLSAAPRRAPDRLEALRVLASVAEEQLKDAPLALWAWTEVLAEEPTDRTARERLQALARVQGDKAGLSQALREQLTREPRGPAARKARLELVSTLEAAGDKDAALAELRHAVRFEPGHKEAWLLLADRLISRGQNGEAAWALEHAASATDDEAERQRTWGRLAAFCRDVLKDAARAELYARRAENMRRAREEPSAPPVPEPTRNNAPRREVTGTRTRVLVPAPANLNLTPSGQIFPADEPATDTHHPGPPGPPPDARPTIEISAVPTDSGGRMPFGDDEPTATEAPEGFVPPSEPAAPARAKAEKKKAPGAKATGTRKALGPGKKTTGSRKALVDSKPPPPVPVDASRELDELMGGGDDESDHTSPSLSIWTRKREPPGPPVPSAPKGKRSAGPPVFEDTSPGHKAAVNPPPARVGPEARSRRGAAPAPAKPSTGADSAFSRVSPSEPEGQAPAYSHTPVQNTAMISWEAPPGKMEPVRKRVRARAGTEPAKAPLAEPASEPAVFQQVREHPLDAELYERIAQYFEERDDAARATLMREIADALEGREGPPPRPPRQPLSAEDRSGLRHPLLRTPPGELLSIVGVALCSLFPVYGRAAGSQEPVRPDSGVGAPAALEALAATERMLGLQAPEVVLSEDNGPPFSLVFTGKPRVLVGKQAVRQVLPAAELRFYAGRALVCLGPDLLALRSLKKDQVLRGMAQLAAVLKAGPASSPEALVVYETLQPRQIEQASALIGSATRQFDMSALADAARDSANRAGLIACGAVGPALMALRLKRALEREVIELVRFAASERYFQLCGVR